MQGLCNQTVYWIMCDEVPALMTLTLSWKLLLFGICVLLQTVPQVAMLRLDGTSPESTMILLRWDTSPEDDAVLLRWDTSPEDDAVLLRWDTSPEDDAVLLRWDTSPEDDAVLLRWDTSPEDDAVLLRWDTSPEDDAVLLRWDTSPEDDAVLLRWDTSPEDDAVLLRWDTSPEDDAETVEEYQIRYGEVGSPYMKAFTIQKTHGIKETLLKSLQPFTEYSISVTPVSIHGIGRVTTIHVKTLEGIPEKPSILYCDGITSTSFRIHWETRVTNGILSSYQIIMAIGPAFRTFAFTDNLTNPMSANISELDPYTGYKLQVRAGTAAGFSEYSSPYTCFTDTAEPSVPQQLQVSVLSPSSIFVQWHTPKIYYKSIAVYVIEIYEGSSLENPDVHWVEGPFKLEEAIITETITGLSTQRQYRLKVAAVTQSLFRSRNYTGDFSEEVIFNLEGQTNSTTGERSVKEDSTTYKEGLTTAIDEGLSA